eukprot:gene9778-2104_t
MEELKNKGNEEFKNQNFTKAIDHYTEALNYDEKKEVLYSNISMSFLKLEKYEEALLNAEKSIQIDPNYIKSLQRKAISLEKLNRQKEALEVYEKLVSLQPNNDMFLMNYTKINEELNPVKISSLDHRRISGEYHQLRYITFSQFDAMLKDLLLNCSKKERIKFISEIFMLIQQHCVKYRLEMKKSLEKTLSQQLDDWMSVFNRKKNTSQSVDELIKSYLSQEDEEDEQEIEEKYEEKVKKFEVYLNTILEKLNEKLIKYQLKDFSNFKLGLTSIFIDMSWIEMRMFYAGSEYYEVPNGKFDKNEVESYEDCDSRNISIFTIFPGYQSENQCYLKPIVYTE